MREAKAVDRALAFLEKEQLPSGQFPMQYTWLDRRDSTTGAPDTRAEQSPFVSFCIAYALRFCEDERASVMVEKTAQFLEREMGPGGLWRYWCRDAPLHRQIPPDADDTSCISMLLREVRGSAPGNESLLLSNTDASGLFFTWFIPRFTSRGTMQWWRTVLGDITWGRAVSFWKAGARRADRDPVVNANVAAYLGECDATSAAVDWVLSIAGTAQDSGDKWYRSAPAFYYAVSRGYARGIKRFGAATAHLESRYSALSHGDGRIGDDALQTAMAVSSLINFGFAPTACEAAVDYLLNTQAEDGGWESHPIYFDGRTVPRIAWGSRSATTGFCVEALARHAARKAS